MFAHEFGWTVDQVLDLTIEQAELISGALMKFYRRQKEAMATSEPGAKEVDISSGTTESINKLKMLGIPVEEI